MHELSIALNILDIAEQESERRGGAAVAAIHLRLGPLAGVVKDALLSAYEMAREESRCRNARLLIEDIPVLVHCPTCLAERAPLSLQELRCPVCASPTPQILHGQEMEVYALEVEI